MIKLQDFLDGLQTASYLDYTLYNREENLFITLYSSEDVESFVIMEFVPLQEHASIISALEQHKK